MTLINILIGNALSLAIAGGHLLAIVAVMSLSAQLPLSQAVVCGGHTAPTCGECPQGNGKGWCNGECLWAGGACTKGCHGTPEAQCTSGTGCTWIGSTANCRDTLSNSIRTASVHLQWFTWLRVLSGSPPASSNRNTATLEIEYYSL